MTAVIKIGGELLETTADLDAVVRHVAHATAEGPVVVVHGGGRELTAEIARRGGAVRMVDGVRVTDEDTLAAAVSVLGGTINTRLVAALIGRGVHAVGLTGVDGALLRADRAPRVRTRAGTVVDLGHVGLPDPTAGAALLESLCRDGWTPVVASLGIGSGGDVLNVNADVAAAHLAVALRAARLVVMGATDGVFDAQGATIPTLTHVEAKSLIESGAARDGMAAKLDACLRAASCGIADVRIVSGRSSTVASGGTRLVSGRTH